MMGYDKVIRSIAEAGETCYQAIETISSLWDIPAIQVVKDIEQARKKLRPSVS